MARRKTDEEFKNEVNLKYNSEYTVLNTYINNKTELIVRHNCNECNNNEYKVKAEYLIRKTNPILCPVCTKKNYSKKRTKTNEKFKEEIFNLVGYEYTPLEEYKGSHTKILMRHNCEKCNNHEWSIQPQDFISGGHRCPKCKTIKISEVKKNSLDDIKKRVFEKCGNEYSVIGDYNGYHNHIIMQHNCKMCNNYNWSVTPNSFLTDGTRCPKCAGNIKYTKEEIEQKILEKYGNEYILIGEYKGVDYSVKLKHNCGNIISLPAGEFLKGKRRCPICAEKENETKGSKAITNYLNNKNYNFKKEKDFKSCFYKRKLFFDFYLEDLNLLIEFDGEGHFYQSYGESIEELKLQKIRDNIKNNWCKNNNINLLRISYKEYNNINTILDLFLSNNYLLFNYNIYFQVNGFEIRYGIYSLDGDKYE